MIPLLFGTSHRRLLGVYTPALGRRQRRGVVICPPFGQEYMRSHRTCRILASRLAAAGVDTFRFDYFGTGNSAGEVEDLSLSGALTDTLAGVQELLDIASVRKVALVGLRVGALVAAQAATNSKAVDRLVLWDPVADGAAYVSGQIREESEPDARGGRQVEGFAFKSALQSELKGASLHALAAFPSQVMIAVSEDLSVHRSLYEHVRVHVPSAQFECLENRPSWTEFGNAGVGAVPAEILGRITAWCI